MSTFKCSRFQLHSFNGFAENDSHVFLHTILQMSVWIVNKYMICDIVIHYQVGFDTNRNDNNLCQVAQQPKTTAQLTNY